MVTWTAHDAFGNVVSITANDQTLSTNTYAPNNGALQQTTYGNGFFVYYQYDELGRTVGICQNGAEQASFVFTYNNQGQVTSHIDTESSCTYEYTYDADGRLLMSSMHATETGNILYLNKLSYDVTGRVTSIDRYYPTAATCYTDSVSYTYDEAGSLATLTQSGAAQQTTYEYDRYGRYVAHTKTNTQSPKSVS